MENPFGTYPGYLLRRAAKLRIARLAHCLAPLGVSVLEASILFLIDRNPGSSQVECGRLLAIQRANMTPIIQRLTHAGWINIHKKSGRTRGLELTQQGEALVECIALCFEEQENWIMASVPKHLRSSVIPILQALCDIEIDSVVTVDEDISMNG